jgi:hypothetical protein
MATLLLELAVMMWYTKNGHRAKSSPNNSEVFDEQEEKETKLHRRV